MGLIAKDPGGNGYDPVEEGVFQAICYGIYDLGTQYSEKWNKSAHRVLITWEIPEQRIEVEKDGKKLSLPRAISKEYTLSLHAKAGLKKDLESWRGRTFTKEELSGFDLANILKANCMIQVLHSTRDDKTYANVSGIMPLMKGVERKAPENRTVLFSLADNNLIPEETPKWIADKIAAAKEYNNVPPKGLRAKENGNADSEDVPDWMKDAANAPLSDPGPVEDEIPF
jgi:hypothetical protein